MPTALPGDKPVFLFEVEDAFQLKGIGLVLVPGIPIENESLIKNVKVGDSVVLKLKNGSCQHVRIKSFPNVRTGRPMTHILLALDSPTKVAAELMGSKVFIGPHLV